MTDDLLEDPLPYWIQTPLEPRRCLVCKAPAEAHCTLKYHPHDISAARAGKYSLHLFALCEDCLRLSRRHPRVLLGFVEGKRR